MNADLRTGRPIQWGSVNKPSSFYKKAYRAHKYLRHIDHVLSSLTYSLFRLIKPSSGPFPSANIEDSSGEGGVDGEIYLFVERNKIYTCARSFTQRRRSFFLFFSFHLFLFILTHYGTTYEYKYDLVL